MNTTLRYLHGRALIKAWEGLNTAGLILTVEHLSEGVYVLKGMETDGRPARCGGVTAMSRREGPGAA